MRVLMTTDAVGGVWTFTRELATVLLAEGHSVYVVNVGPPPSDAHLAVWNGWKDVFPSSFGYHVLPASLEWMEDNISAYSAAAPELIELAELFSPDVFVSGQFCFGRLPLSIPIVVVAHSDVLSWARACRGGRLDCSTWLNTYVKLVGDGLEMADAVVAPTRWMQAALCENFTLPQHTVVIPNGVTLRGRSHSSDRKFSAVSAGRLWDEAKNLKLLEALPAGVPILVAGDSGHTSMRHQRTTALGKLPQAELLELFQSSSIYICTSIYEPFGLAPLEAALCGCAVVANDIPSLREVWGDAALFFRDADELAATLDQLATSAYLERWRRRAHERAMFFTAERMAARYLNLFERLTRAGTLRQRSAEYAA